MPYAVQCDDNTTRPLRTREEAERWLKNIEDFGACHLEHKIVEVPDKSKRAR